MKVVLVKSREDKKKFLNFRKEIFSNYSHFVDNDFFVLKELFFGKSSFTYEKEITPINIENKKGEVVCQGIIIFTDKLKEYISLSYFMSKDNQDKAVKLLISKANEIGKKHKCKKIVIGLNGHVNYGLGFLDSDFDSKNSFSGACNPSYYNDYFRNMRCREIYLNTYKLNSIDNRLNRYKAVLDKLEKGYEFRYFDKSKFDEYSKYYTDLNNKCFIGHRYYYKRLYEEDKEMLKELFLFMKEDSLIFAFKDNKPVAFVMWYPDFNKLVKPGEVFGTVHFFRNIFKNKKIGTAKVMEYGVLPEYRKVGLPLGLLHQIFKIMGKYKIRDAETSWILEENKDSSSFCEAICDSLYKRYVVYEKSIK